MTSDNPAMQYADPKILEDELSEKEKLLRELFIDHYLETYSPYRAAVSCGFLAAFAEDFAKQFMAEGYVRRRIRERELAEDAVERIEKKKRMVEAMLFEQATYNGPGASHGARVSALSKLSNIYGMEAVVKTESEVGYKGGVMVVPALLSPDAWGQSAAASQAALKQTVKE